jgi:segregation and condensation protein A
MVDLQSIANQIQTVKHTGNLAPIDVSQAMLILSNLLKRKTKLLLPLDKTELEDVNENATVENMQEDFAKYQKLSLLLDQIEDKEERSFTRTLTTKIEREEADVKDYLGEVKLEDLSFALHHVIARLRDREGEIRFSEEVEKESYSLQSKMTDIRDLLKKSRQLDFETLFGEAKSKLEIIVTFLAMLELIKLKEVKAIQERRFGPIVIAKV